MKLLFLTLLISILTSHRCKAQKIVFSPGTSYQGQWFAEFNLMYSNSLKRDRTIFHSGPRIGAETNFKKGGTIYVPKIGYELSAYFFGGRGNALCYIEDGSRIGGFYLKQGLH
jgi:hypothetical protein